MSSSPESKGKARADPNPDEAYPITHLLVTVGSTLFPSLTDHMLSPPMLDHLSTTLGIKLLTVQYGRAALPASARTSNIHLDARGSGYGLWKGMSVMVMRFANDFEGLVAKHEAVISHAGSGSILTALRSDTPKRLMVVPNDSLMDNHQAELADALGSEGYLQVSAVQQLEEKLGPWLTGPEGKVFPTREEGVFRRMVDEVAGFA